MTGRARLQITFVSCALRVAQRTCTYTLNKEAVKQSETEQLCIYFFVNVFDYKQSPIITYGTRSVLPTHNLEQELLTINEVRLAKNPLGLQYNTR